MMRLITGQLRDNAKWADADFDSMRDARAAKDSFKSVGVTANCSRLESGTLFPSESFRSVADRASQCGTRTMLCGLSSLATTK